MVSNYYNEHDRQAAAWLSALSIFGEIPHGVVDDRDVQEVRPADLAGYVQHHFFAGIGGWPYALKLAGWPADLPVWTASLPCQPFSVAGQQRGTKDERHLWPVFRELVEQCRPPVIFGEQVASKPGRAWLAAVQADLEALGYITAAADLCAAGVGAPHIRQRLYWVAYNEEGRREQIDQVPERRDEGSRAQGGERSEHCRSVGGVAYNGYDPAERERRWRLCTVDRVAYRGDQGLEIERKQPARGERPPVERGGPVGAWSDVVYLPCADGKARPVKPGVEPLVDGLPGVLASVLSLQRQVALEIENYARSTKENPIEVLRILREGIQQETLLEWSPGGIHGLHEKALLLDLLLGAEATRDRSSDCRSSKKEGIEILKRAVQRLRMDGGLIRAPHRREPDEQQAEQPPTTVQALSLVLAQHAETYRAIVLNGYASAGRVGSLRGYGNAIVPQVAAVFIKSVIECLS